MKEKLSIGEFAKLINTTTETLRHYDRVNLLKPIEVNAETGYRYYSILQYEKLATIQDLRKLGMCVDEIKKYFDNRNFKQSVALLKEQHEQLMDKIKKLQVLEAHIGEKIKHLEVVSEVSEFDEIFIKVIEERKVCIFDEPIKNEVELTYACRTLENQLKRVVLAPLLASNRIGLIISGDYKALNAHEGSNLFCLFIKDHEQIQSEYIKKIPGGTYVSMYYKGEIWEARTHLEKIFDYIEAEKYAVCGDILQVIQIDVSVTDQEQEALIEIQVPIKKLTFV